MESDDYWKISLGVAIVLLLFLIYLCLHKIASIFNFLDQGVLNLRTKMGLRKDAKKKKPADQ